MGSARKNQRNRILEILITARGNDVPSVDLGRVSLQYGARIKELRELGFTIVNRTVRRDGAVHGYFSLKAGPLPISIEYPNANSSALENTLFSLQPGTSYHDPEEAGSYRRGRR